MDTTRTGLFAGLLLALIAVLGGFWAFLLAVVLGTIGLVIGAQLDGRIDLAAAFRGRRRG